MSFSIPPPKKRRKLNENDNDEIKTETQIKQYIDRATALCIGAAIGDSIGSYCELSNCAIKEKELQQAMTMPGLYIFSFCLCVLYNFLCIPKEVEHGVQR